MIGEGIAFVALGSNLGDSRALVVRAMEALRPLLRSSLWESAPMDCPPGSQPFVNAVAGVQTRLEPIAFLAELKKLEQQFGRPPKGILNEPRLLDLDLIALGSSIVDTPELILPHPRAHLRRFVMEPLAEIAPDYVLHGQTKSVRELLAHLGGQSIRKL